MIRTSLATALLAAFVILGAPTPPHAEAGEPSPTISTAVAHPDRPPTDRARDEGRKPAEVLTFFGIEPGMKVADLMAGSGYYTDILCRVVGSEGKVYLHTNAFVRKRFGKTMLPVIEKRLAQPELAHCVRLDDELDALELPDGELDAVLMVLFYHDTYWQKTDRKKMNELIFAALKPGGTYGIVDHHAEAGSKDRDVQTIHRVDAETVKAEILAAGFTFSGESDVLRHPEDERTKNVFDPSIRGQTDRFVYKFTKPK